MSFFFNLDDGRLTGYIFADRMCRKERRECLLGGGNGPDEDAQLWVVLYCVVLC